MSQAEKLRVGVVGGGYIGTTVGGQFNTDPRSTVTALADVNQETRRTAGDALYVGDGSQYEDYREMYDSEPLDAVLVGTPHTLHYEMVTAALDRDLHVFCDKPLTTDLEEARELAERDEESEQVLMVGYQRHLNPAFQTARERWQGDAGESDADAAGGESNPDPDFLSAEITQNWISRFEDTWRTDPDLSGGGNLYDTGSHLVDAVLWTTGLVPEEVSAEMVFADDEGRVDERAILTVEFKSGAQGTISVHSDAPCVREHIHVWDEEGAVYLEGRQWEKRKLERVDEDSTTVIPYIDRSQQRSKAEAFIDCIETGETPPATARDALAVTALTEAAYESARSGERVSVDVE
ncbi:Gfo/Idh/MocA family oxidoreductase (plasmid) [Halorussus limi]|uniref:Gfo/Idh/MocA family oxidoreductase n=1 Tax=Halorussus limi TaxID=2938695 RepID=A0A8U0I0M2_9EURY|nr:Gfo/Idh/MocA family oxidoreductase [Halorussus limi]UPV76573.1 Gfo/Idh/MocA family oxidoreductase [Halorussus limi]